MPDTEEDLMAVTYELLNAAARSLGCVAIDSAELTTAQVDLLISEVVHQIAGIVTSRTTISTPNVEKFANDLQAKLREMVEGRKRDRRS